MGAHIDDLLQQVAAEDVNPAIEQIELRLKAPQFSGGSTPLHIIAELAESFRQLIGYAALRLTSGGIRKRRVPSHLYGELDMRLSALLPGSSRLIITSASNRDLLGDGISKGALDRVFRLLDTNGEGQDFLAAVTELGPSSARRLRDLIDIVRVESAELECYWRYAGETVHTWNGSRRVLDQVSLALAVTEVKAKEEISIDGVIELLSKRERIQLRADSGEIVRILYPKRLLAAVSALHLDQRVKFLCAVTETENPLTGESSTFYELIKLIDRVGDVG